jgi:hypothetical protein
MGIVSFRIVVHLTIVTNLLIASNRHSCCRVGTNGAQHHSLQSISALTESIMIILHI